MAPPGWQPRVSLWPCTQGRPGANSQGGTSPRAGHAARSAPCVGAAAGGPPGPPAPDPHRCLSPRFLLMMGVLFCCGAGFFIRRRMYPPPLIEEPAFNVSYTRQPPNPAPGQPAPAPPAPPCRARLLRERSRRAPPRVCWKKNFRPRFCVSFLCPGGPPKPST